MLVAVLVCLEVVLVAVVMVAVCEWCNFNLHLAATHGADEDAEWRKFAECTCIRIVKNLLATIASSSNCVFLQIPSLGGRNPFLPSFFPAVFPPFARAGLGETIIASGYHKRAKPKALHTWYKRKVAER